MEDACDEMLLVVHLMAMVCQIIKSPVVGFFSLELRIGTLAVFLFFIYILLVFFNSWQPLINLFNEQL